MKMIELTQYKTGKPVLVNLEKVSSIEPAGSGAWVFSVAQNYSVKESYEEVLKRIAEVNDKQFCFVRRPEKPETVPCSGKAFHEQKIVSCEAVYTGGCIWNFFGELEGGKFFMAFDDDWYDIMILDENPLKAGGDEFCDFENAYYPEWQEKHTVHEYNDGNETAETLGMFRRIYNFLKTKDFIDKESHITRLDNYEYQLRMEGKL